MAMCGDDVILTFIAKKLMEQDKRMASDILVDEQFADFLSQNNKIRKSLASTNALSGGGGHVPHQVKYNLRLLWTAPNVMGTIA